MPSTAATPPTPPTPPHGGDPLPRTRLSRRQLLGLLVAAGTVPLLAACGGGDDDTTPTTGPDDTPQATERPIVMSTFTPQPATSTPGASPTVGTPTPQPTIDPQATSAVGEPTPTQAPNEIRAPLVRLGTTAGDPGVVGWVSAFTWYDAETQSVGGRLAGPYAEMPPTRLTVGTADRLEIRVDASPYPITEARIELFPWEGNVALPQAPTGAVLSDVPVFVRQTEPLFAATVSGAEPLTVQPDLPAGTVIASIQIDWTLPDDLAAAIQRPVYVTCVVAIEVT